MLLYSKSQQTSLTLQEKGTDSTIGHFALLTLFEKEVKAFYHLALPSKNSAY
jgi:hypothetical protein